MVFPGDICIFPLYPFKFDGIFKVHNKFIQITEVFIEAIRGHELEISP